MGGTRLGRRGGWSVAVFVLALVVALAAGLAPAAEARPKERAGARAEQAQDGRDAEGRGVQAGAVRSQAVPGQYIVTLKQGTDPTAKARGLARAHGLDLLHVYEYALTGFAARVPAGRLAQLQADPDVARIDEDREVSIDAQAVPTGIDRVDGELSRTLSGNGSGAVDVDVAVIDTGIDLDHPDLAVFGKGKNCVRGGRSADDGHGHGTHVAGTIGAKDDGTGVVGVAPGARLWPVRVLDNNASGSWSSIICGIDFVTANADKIEVANMSLGGGAASADKEPCGPGTTALHNAICNSVKAGVTYAVAAGNSKVDANNIVPATYGEVITVSALADFNGQPGGGAPSTCRADVDDTFANFSNYGADIDLIAPGVCINSTWKGGGYNTISGTSMASPHVAGAAAHYTAGNGSATPAQVQTALQGAGTTDWNDVDDPDPDKEKLLNVAAF